MLYNDQITRTVAMGEPKNNLCGIFVKIDQIHFMTKKMRQLKKMSDSQSPSLLLLNKKLHFQPITVLNIDTS
jgi:hypothetical protein